MSTAQKPSIETRGRPRKQQTRTLSPLYKHLFSDNSAIIHTSFLIYVFQVFVDTKTQKRVGHKDGGFTIYDKIDCEYCFDTIEDELGEWGCEGLRGRGQGQAHDSTGSTQSGMGKGMGEFVRLLPALGPRIILREICKLIDYVVRCYQNGQSEREILGQLTDRQNLEKLDLMYPYMRFVPQSLHQLKMDKNQRMDRSNNLPELVRQRVNQLWQPLLQIIIYTVINCLQGNPVNKYFKPFFSDAEKPSETYIGQLNLDQVVKSVRRLQNNPSSNTNINFISNPSNSNPISSQYPYPYSQPISDRSNRGSEYNIYYQDDNLDKIRKMRSIVDADGTRTVVQIIKAPEVQRANSEAIGVGGIEIGGDGQEKREKEKDKQGKQGREQKMEKGAFSSPTGFNKGFMAVRSMQSEQINNRQQNEQNSWLKSSWKSVQKNQQQVCSPFKGTIFKLPEKQSQIKQQQPKQQKSPTIFKKQSEQFVIEHKQDKQEEQQRSQEEIEQNQKKDQWKGKQEKQEDFEEK